MKTDQHSKSAKTEQDPESCWETPLWLVDRVRAAFGGVIGLDPCTTRANPTGALAFYAPPDDGILLPWEHGPIYVNPPYGYTIRYWTRKSIAVAAGGQRIILLVPSRTCGRWFHEIAKVATAIIFIKGRLRFSGATENAKFPSALIGLNHDLADLEDLGFRMLGKYAA